MIGFIQQHDHSTDAVKHGGKSRKAPPEKACYRFRLGNNLGGGLGDDVAKEGNAGKENGLSQAHHNRMDDAVERCGKAVGVERSSMKLWKPPVFEPVAATVHRTGTQFVKDNFHLTTSSYQLLQNVKIDNPEVVTVYRDILHFLAMSNTNVYILLLRESFLDSFYKIMICFFVEVFEWIFFMTIHICPS